MLKSRPKTLCVFDEIYKLGIGQIRRDFQGFLEGDNEEEYLDIIRIAGLNFGNLGIELTKDEQRFILKKVVEYMSNYQFFLQDPDDRINLSVHDYYAPDKTRFQVFRESFGSKGSSKEPSLPVRQSTKAE